MLALKSCFAGLTCRKFEPDLAPPADVVDLFRSYCGNKPHMDAIDLQRFLTEVQREADYETQWQAQALMDMACNRKQKGKHAVLFSLDDFFNLYLFNDVLNGPIHAKVHHDMTQPMSHYYIFTGHNSYLTGNQLSSDCSVEPIIEALRRGVRVIELDLWPNSTRDGIHVKHGGTLTAPVDFEECIRALKDYAFVKSSYPVIITFEDHLTASLQAEAAKIVHRVLGKLLYSPAPPHEGFKEFPSPKSLMGRILISTKPPKEYLEMLSNSGSASMARAAHEELSDDDDLGNSKEYLQTKSVGEDVGKEEEEVMEPEYGNLIAIRAGKADRWRPLKDALISDCYVKRVSLSEPELSKVVKSHPDVVLGYLIEWRNTHEMSFGMYDF